MGVADTPYEEPIKKLLGVPENLRVLCTVALGYPAEKPVRNRENLKRKVHWEKYGVQKGDQRFTFNMSNRELIS